MTNRPVALVTGYSGESGSVLVRQLLRSGQYCRVILVGHQPIDFHDVDVDVDANFKEKMVLKNDLASFIARHVPFRNIDMPTSIESMTSPTHFMELKFISAAWRWHRYKPLP
jgi:NAD(P)-dependent dehydrogenase (short-subunit alcohol dehydrogenase family)